MPFGNLRLTIVAWDLSLGSLRPGSLTWKLSLAIWELSLRHVRVGSLFGTFTQELRWEILA